MKIRFETITQGILLFAGIALTAAGCFGADGVLEQRELQQLLSNAKTAEDFQRLAKHFEAKAAAVGGNTTAPEKTGMEKKMASMMANCEEKMKGKEAAKPAAEPAPAAHQH